MHKGFPQPGRRITVVGNCGSGKTTLARAIAHRRGVPYISVDQALWEPGWVMRDDGEVQRRLTEAMSADAWASDGNLGSRAHYVLPLIDTVIWLDLPKHLVMRRLLARTIRRAWTQEELFSGNREGWRHSFASRESILPYAWNAHAVYRRQYHELFADPEQAHLTRIRLTTPLQVARLLRDVV
ncbi:MAG: AAA family ATPase [Phycisphaerales bacterium JB063]